MGINIFPPPSSLLSISLDSGFEPDPPVPLKGIIMVEIADPYLFWNAVGEGIAGRVTFLVETMETNTAQTLFLHGYLLLLLLIVYSRRPLRHRHYPHNNKSS
jgi:hypothetical protein